MTADTTPQQQAVATLVEYFQPDCKGRIAVEPAKDESQLTAATSTGDGLMDFRYLTFGEIVDCLADAGLLCSSPVQPKDEDGSLRSVPPAAGEAEREKLVDVVAEALRECPFRFGPNTRESIVRGMDKVFLTGGERRDLARMALDAVNEVSHD